MSSIICNVINHAMEHAIGVLVSLQCLSHETAPFVSQTSRGPSGCVWELTNFMNSLSCSELVTFQVTFGISAIHGKVVPPHQPALIYLRKGERYIVTLQMKLGDGTLYSSLLSTRITTEGRMVTVRPIKSRKLILTPFSSSRWVDRQTAQGHPSIQQCKHPQHRMTQQAYRP